MAQVKLKRALLVEGKFYQPGVQEISDKALSHPHFVRYIKLGIIVPPENEELEKLENPVERAQRLHRKEIELAAKRDELLKKVDVSDEKSEEADADSEALPVEGKKKNKKG